MAIQDSNPDRRNLILMSFSIIAFYIGDGYFDPNEGVSLPLIKMNFNNPAALGCLALLMNFWFLFRYWVSSWGEMKSELQKDISGDRKDSLRLFTRYFKSKISDINSNLCRNDVYHISFEDKKMNIKLRYIEIQNGSSHTENVAISNVSRCIIYIYWSIIGFLYLIAYLKISRRF